ncbi:hypothetical protein LTR36_009009 [Oleoguttula mirabilis]|uniref:Uncharacterized protein n=1 Tax=Oleoguttula mirabilis TaxID=1507867 RepID=A0AAV9J7D8_9PEZI|nr:hypothetical protein LTR36_009009 [Oleoguttula mirabilis]
MAAVITELQAAKDLHHDSTWPLHDNARDQRHPQGEDTDITEILNQYAPEPASTSPPGDRTTSQYSYKPKKRRRPDHAPNGTVGSNADDLEHGADESGGSSSTGDAFPLSVSLPAAGVPGTTAPGDISHVPFMQMLQNINTPGLLTNGADATSVQSVDSVLQGWAVHDTAIGVDDMSSMTTANPTGNASLAAPDAPWDASMASLLELVDWDASLESCWGFYENEQNQPLGGWVEDETMF